MINNNHTRKEVVVAENVCINLGGGGSAIVDLFLNEEGFLLIEGLGMDNFNYNLQVHDRNLTELQILYPDDIEEDEE